MVKVSCILPAYNEEKYVGNALSSLLSQDFKDLEIVFVDDGSTDRTKEIALEFAKKDSRVRVFSLNHGGPGAARNFGAKQAKGKVLVFPDADEVFPSNYVSELVNPILSGKVKGTTTRIVLLNPDSSIFSKIKYNEYDRRFNYANNRTTVFRAILRSEFLRVNGFDNSSDYFDDGSLYSKLKYAPFVTNAVSYTTMSSSPSEIVVDSAWGVKSHLEAGNKKIYVYFIGVIFAYMIGVLLVFLNPLFFVFGWLFLGIYGYFSVGRKLSLFDCIAFYPIYFFSKTIGLVYGVFRYLFFRSKGK